MLNRSKLFIELEKIASDIFLDTTQENLFLQMLWAQLCAASLLHHKLSHAHVCWPLPTWDGAINATFAIKPITYGYDLISVDGSQIYPDRHSGVSCYLINIGEVVLRYDTQNPVTFYTQPYVFSGNNEDSLKLSTEFINGKRQDLELYAGLVRAQELNADDRSHLLLFDGSLIFWHLEAKDPILKELFLSRYLATLFALYKKKILFASYISAPKSRELMNVVRAYGCDFDEKNQERVAALSRFSDGGLLSHLLKEGQRTTVFKNHAKVSGAYPDSVHPHFFYMHVGSEIGRVEIPAFIAIDAHKVDWVASCVLDQCRKGYGYPVSLAVAHEQAVLKGPYREFFYHLLSKMNVERNRRLITSTKLSKKRGMAI